MTQPNSPSPLASLDPVNDPLQQASYYYPQNLSTQPHMMLFQIAKQSKSQDNSLPPVAGGIPNITKSGQVINAQTMGNWTSSNLYPPQATITSTSIGLYMPGDIVYRDSQEYDTPSILNSSLGILSSAVGAAIGGVEKLAGVGFGLSALVGIVGGLTENVALKYGTLKLGYAINPVIEVLYTAPNLRSFQFNFVFAPRNAAEQQMVQQIIYQFRRNQAPELPNGVIGSGIADNILNGLIFVPPSQFEITIMWNNGQGFVQNPNVPNIDTCVLRSVETNYTPDNMWITHYDGTPNHIELTLEFLELNILTRTQIDATGGGF